MKMTIFMFCIAYGFVTALASVFETCLEGWREEKERIARERFSAALRKTYR